MREGDLVLVPDVSDPELCLILSISPEKQRVYVFNSTWGRMENYRWDWMRKHGRVIG